MTKEKEREFAHCREMIESVMDIVSLKGDEGLDVDEAVILTIESLKEQIKTHKLEADQYKTALEYTAKERAELRVSIRKHYSRRGHSSCWENDVELWQTVMPKAEFPHSELPHQDEFLIQCKAYYESRIKGVPWKDPPVKEKFVSTCECDKPRLNPLTDVCVGCGGKHRF